MSEITNNEITAVQLVPYNAIVKGTIGVDSFIINDYILNLIENTGSYTLEIIKGSQTQSVTVNDAISIASVEQIVTSQESGGVNTVRVTLSDGTYNDFDFYNGAKGDKGDPGLTTEERQEILDAEALRIANESLRVNAEASRVDNEASRVLYEEIRRGEEAERVQQEKNRRSAESSRASAENTRSVAETARNNAESTRNNNETSRNNAETSRQNQWTSLQKDVNDAIGQITGLQEDVNTLMGQVEGATRDALDAVVEVNNKIEEYDNIVEEIGEAAGELANFTVQCESLSSDADPYGTYEDGVLTLGIPQGKQGERGDAFYIKKTYASISAMNADYSGTDVAVGEFVIISTNNVDDPDNAKVYIKGDQQYNFIVDLSGSAGINGIGISSIAKSGTSGNQDTYTITYTNGGTSTFVVTNGQDGTNGIDGVSPSVSISKSGSIATITITDKTGTTTAELSDGIDGADGADGVTFTPSVSNTGVISWTNDGNRQNPQSIDMVTAVISALPSAVGVSF